MIPSKSLAEIPTANQAALNRPISPNRQSSSSTSPKTQELKARYEARQAEADKGIAPVANST
jgi:hypothetical protein